MITTGLLTVVMALVLTPFGRMLNALASPLYDVMNQDANQATGMGYYLGQLNYILPIAEVWSALMVIIGVFMALGVIALIHWILKIIPAVGSH